MQSKQNNIIMLRLKQVLSEQGVTGKQLAEKMGVTPQYISGIVRETGSASLDVLSKIAKTLNVPLSSLFDDYNGIITKCPNCGQEFEVELRAKSE